jgi:rubrerythrin
MSYYYYYPVPPYRYEEYYREPSSYKTLQEALGLVRQAIEGEREDERFYDYLISVAPNEEEKAIITRIRDIITFLHSIWAIRQHGQ